VDEDATERLGAEVRSAVSRVYSRFRSERATGELGDAAVGVLAQLLKHGPSSLSELSERARVTPGSMSQTVNRLAAGGYLVRGRDLADGRRVLFTATPEGLATAAAARGRGRAWLNARLDELDVDDRAVLAHAARILAKIADS
jgi:DNA-binding MarR family transcriptional regulator